MYPCGQLLDDAAPLPVGLDSVRFVRVLVYFVGEVEVARHLLQKVDEEPAPDGPVTRHGLHNERLILKKKTKDNVTHTTVTCDNA